MLSVEFPIDVQRAIQKLQGNENMFFSMLERLGSVSFDKHILKLTENIQLKHWKKVRYIVNQQTGVWEYVGAGRLAKIYQNLQEAID